MKIAPIIHAIHRSAEEGKVITYGLIHTGQHNDNRMSGAFLSNWKYLNHTLI